MFETIQGDVKLYPYRSARVSNITLIVPRDSVAGLEEQLALEVNKTRSNHTVYEITQDGRAPFYIYFTDEYAWFGSSIEEGSH